MASVETRSYVVCWHLDGRNEFVHTSDWATARARYEYELAWHAPWAMNAPLGTRLHNLIEVGHGLPPTPDVPVGVFHAVPLPGGDPDLFAVYLGRVAVGPILGTRVGVEAAVAELQRRGGHGSVTAYQIAGTELPERRPPSRLRSRSVDCWQALRPTTSQASWVSASCLLSATACARSASPSAPWRLPTPLSVASV
jgi:hypothetical protein